MKKGFIFSFIISFIFILGLAIFPIHPKTNFSTDKITQFNQFESSVVAELQNDDYSYIEIDKNVTLSQLKQQIEPNSKDNQITIFSLEDNKILTKNQIVEYCENNDLLLEETENGYQVINKYALKRLIIFGKLPSNHNASKVFSFDDLNILFYPTIEETKSAYQNLNSKTDVIVDFIVSAQANKTNSITSIVDNWSESKINIQEYNNFRTDKEVIVAVLDTGINTQHFWLKDRILKKSNTMIGTAYEISKSTHTTIDFDDDNGHGSHVAGIIVDQTPANVKILPIKVLDNLGKGDFANIILALEKIYTVYSNEYNNIVCANLSLGGTSSDFEDKNSFNNWFKKLKVDKNILSVVAAGNKSTNTSTFLPAACDDAIVVSALKESSKAPYYMEFDNSYSNFGKSVDISAPGTKITSAWKPFYDDNNNFIINSKSDADGTSQAAPHVSAAVANLALHNDKTFTADEIEKKILYSAIDLDNNGFDEKLGFGALNYSSFNTILATIEHTASNKTVTYDGNYHNISISVTKPTNYTIKYSLENDNTYTITDISTNSKFKNATDGAITIYYQISCPGYETATGSKTLTINKRALTYSVENQTSTYGNATHINKSKYTKTSGTPVAGDNLGITLNTNATQSSNVGTYNIYLTYSNNNYSINSNTATLTINPRDVEISISNTSNVYGDEFDLANITYSCNNLYANDNLGVVLNTSNINFNKAGTYNITYASHTNSNYNITNKTTVKGTHTITAKNVIINIDNQSSIYGENIELTADKYSVSDLVGSDNLNITLTTTAQNNLAKDYPITATYTQNSNYNVTINEGTYSVTKRDMSLKIGNKTFTYGNQISLTDITYSIISGSFAFNDNLSITFSTTATSTSSIGEYDISLTFNAINNYNVTLTKGKAIITPRVITIAITNQNIEYGNMLTLDKSSYSITKGNIVNNDIVEIILTSTVNPENKDEYLITAASSNNNYEIEIENSQITIVPRKITISTHQFKTYGDDINLSGEIYKVEQGSIVNNDDLELNFSTIATKTSIIGDYAISLVSANKNYDVSLIDSYLTIIPKTILITILNQESVYGDEIKLDHTKYSVDETQLVEGSNLEITLHTNVTNKSNVGNYSITASTDNENYNLRATNGTYTITKRKLSIRLYNQTTPHTFSLTYNTEDYDLMSGSIMSGDELNIQLYTNATALSFAGDYELMATYANDNYDITFTDATLTIEFSYVDALMIVVPSVIVILVATLILVVVIKRKNKTIPLYKKWTK